MTRLVSKFGETAFVFPLKHLPIKRFSELTGTTPGAIRARIQRGHWAEGIHYRRDPLGQYQIILSAVDEWIEKGI